jgi:cell shape-determining protein MreC
VAIVSIDWFRDLVLCIFGLGATVAVVILVVLAFLFYFRLRPMLDSMKKTARIVEDITSTVEAEVAEPLAQMASFVQGIRQAFNLFSRFARKGED